MTKKLGGSRSSTRNNGRCRRIVTSGTSGRFLKRWWKGRTRPVDRWVGPRTSQIKVLNSHGALRASNSRHGSYVNVLVTTSFPNSLVGEIVA